MKRHIFCDRFFCSAFNAVKWCIHLVQLEGFQKLTTVNQALNKFFLALEPERLAPVSIPLRTALKRVTAKSVVAEKPLPLFDCSAVDGYALKAEDTVEASQFQPRTFNIVNKETVEKGELKAIWTGAALPKGADTVVMLEHTKKSDGKIGVLVSLPRGANVSRKGEDVEKGEVVVETGVRLQPYHLGLLAALGIEQVQVVKKPTVALLATGSELVALGKKLEPNQKIEVNSLLLSGFCSELGVESFSLGIAGDNEREIEEKVRKGLAEADVVITTGGTSVGAYDLVPKAVRQIDPRGVVVHGIAMRPGMPTALAVLQRKPVIVLSGNPVAATIGFEVFVRPLIQRLLGTRSEARPRLKATLTRKVPGVLGRQVFLRVRVRELGDEFLADPIRVKGSSIITTLTKANGYVVIPEDREGLKENEQVAVNLFDRVEKDRNV